MMMRTVNAFSLIVLGLGAASLSWGDVTLVRDGHPSAKIYATGPLQVPELKAQALRNLTDAQKMERARISAVGKVVEDLNYHLEKMSGTKLAVVETPDPADITGPAIVIGSLAVKAGAVPTLITPVGESYRILVKGDRVLIGGESDYGARHGVYELLRTLGCDWVMPGVEGEIIPQVRTVIVGNRDVSRKPDFEVRKPWYSGGHTIVKPSEFKEFDTWLIRQQQTSGDMPAHPTFFGGGHYWGELIKKNKQLLTEKPEMRALIQKRDGTIDRGWSQLEPTNPDVVDLTIADIRNIYQKNGWSKDHPYVMCIGPNDGGGYSISPEALAAGSGRIDPLTGDTDQIDALILYANHVLAKTKSEFPNLKAGFYLYSVHADFPQRYKPDPRLILNIADITYSRYYSLLDRRSPTRTYQKGILEQWKKLAQEQGNVYWFYGYNWNLAENLMPYSKLKIWGQDLPYYYDMGVRGHNNEQDKAWAIVGPHNYLMARMGWDVRLDWKKVLTEYCAKAFGAGGPAMEKYYLLLIDTQESRGLEASALGAVHLVLDREFIAKSRALFMEAKAAAKGEMEKRRIDYFASPIEMLAVSLDYHDAMTRFDFPAAQTHYQGMLALWEQVNGQNSNLVSRYGKKYIEKWLIAPFLSQALRYSTNDYSIVHKLPDALKTCLDPHTKGQEMGFFRTERVDRDWITTKTFSSTWDAQGLGSYRPGAIWYRDHFTVPKNLEGSGKGLGLFVGAVEDGVNVWINGQYAGSGKGYIKPFQFDLTKHINYGGDNVIALQVTRDNKLNELNTGGVLYPCFVFAGPRLDQPAPVNEPARRILPGGSLGEIEE